jgi:hypothetical protein
VQFFNGAICVSWSELSPLPGQAPASQAELRKGRIIRRPDCQSERFDPLLRGRTERFGGWLDSPTPVGSECHNMYINETLQCRMVGTEFHSV